MKKNKERTDENMKKNKGFTLIELLAVIVILAIIALIAVPVVMNIIGKANKSAFKDSAYGLLKAGESYYTSELLEDVQGITEDKVFTFPNNIEGLEFKGSKPTSGSMTVRKDGKVSMAISNGKYCVTKGFDDEDVTISEGDCGTSNVGNTSKTLSTLATTYTFKKQVVSTSLESDGTVATATTYEDEVINVPTCITNKTKCAAGTPVAIKVNATETYKFYVLNDDTTKNEVTLIMYRNLYSSTDENNGNVAWVNKSDYNDDTNYGIYGNNNKGPLTALKVLKERTRGWTNIPAYTYILTNDADGLNGSNTYSPISKPATATSESPVENVRARLPRREEIYAVNNSTTLTNTPWLYENLYNTGDNNTYGYWTSTADSTYSNDAWYVNYGGAVVSISVHDGSYIGLRPVITLSK